MSIILAACDGHTSVEGYVYDKDGKPIENAIITLEYGGDKFEARSDKSGAFSVGLVHAPFIVGLTLTASKKGYKQSKDSFSSSSKSERNYKIVLERGSPSD